MTTLRALLYADARTLVNLLRDIRRAPARAIMWTVFALFVAGFVVVRIVRAAHRATTLELLPPLQSSDVIVCAGIVLFGVAAVFGSRFAGLFAHPAEARFIIGSPATPFVATLYVQAREVVRGSARRGLGILYAAVFYLPERIGAGTLVRDLCAIVLATLAISAAPLARQLLSTKRAAAAAVAGYACIAAGTLPLVRDAFAAFGPPGTVTGAVLRLPAWHPGRLLLARAHVQFAALGALLALTALLIVTVARAARDAYPELYELSMKRLQRAERLRGRFFAVSAALEGVPVRARSRSAAGVPSGAAVVVWRAWTEYRRTHAARSTAVEAAALLCAGYAVARLTAAADPQAVAGIASSLANVLFILALARASSLGNELRRPLFWLGEPALATRLGALAFAQSWRIGGWFVLLAIGLAAGNAPPAGILAAGVAAPAALLLAAATGYASYGLLPNDVDQRGPMLLVRWVIGYCLLVPATAAGAGVALAAGAPAAGVAAGAAAALFEAAALIAFAAWRIDRISIPLR
jgi:hypothetical protein